MYDDFKGEKVTIIVSSRGNNILEYVGILEEENENDILLSNVDVSFLMYSFQKGLFGENISTYKKNIDKVTINKKYIMSCYK